MESVEIVPLDMPEFGSEDPVENAMIKRIQDGELFENIDDLTPRYRAVLERTLEIAAQGEVTVLTWAETAVSSCPDLGAKIALAASIQDEVGHAHQQGMLWERFGINMQEEAFERDPTKYWSFPMMEYPVDSYIEFIVAQALLDRAGRYTTWDIERHCSFAPYRRTLRKVNYEEVFHFRHGAFWTEYYWNKSDECREAVQKAVDWIFPHGVFWYGRPDHLKGQVDQWAYGVRKWTNDTMRDKWLQSVGKLAKRIGFKIPAHYDEEKKKYVLDMPYPMSFKHGEKEWINEQCEWTDVVNNLKRGGPMRPAVYERLQREEWGSALW